MKLKLMAEYFCSPIWYDDGINMGDINPNDLPISDELKKQLFSWAEMYDNILDIDNPNLSGFNSIEQENYFVEMGQQIYTQLQSELGNSYEIRYVITV